MKIAINDRMIEMFTQATRTLTKDQLRAIGNRIDQDVREAIGKVDASILYFPEPNTMVKLVGNKLECSFGVGSSEGATFMKKLIYKRKLEPREMEFESEITNKRKVSAEDFDAKIFGDQNE